MFWRKRRPFLNFNVLTPLIFVEFIQPALAGWINSTDISGVRHHVGVHLEFQYFVLVKQ